MRGVFGAGVATYLEESYLYKQIKAIHAASAGAFAAAYLLTLQTRLGSSIYYEDLIEDFITVSGFWGGISDRLANRYIRRSPKLPVRDAVNLDRLMYAATRTKTVLTDKLKGHDIYLWIKVLELESGKTKYIHIEEHEPLELLRASASLIPYVSKLIRLGGKLYTDAGVVDPIGFKELRRRYPDDKIVVVFCGEVGRKLKNKLRNCIEAWFASMEYGREYYDLFAKADLRAQQDIELIRRDPRALFIYCPKESAVATRTCDPIQLKKAYQAGITAGSAIERFLSEP